LRNQGEDVRLLVVIDSIPPTVLDRMGVRAVESIGARLGIRYERQLMLARLWIQVSWVLSASLRRGLKELYRELRSLLPHLYHRYRAGARVQTAELGPKRIVQGSSGARTVRARPHDFGRFWRHLWAQARYRPQHYDGAVSLIITETTVKEAGRQDAGWERWAERVDTVIMPGNHYSLVGKNRALLVAKLVDLYHAALSPTGGPKPT
jgi:thioesterase domain-containing protein